MNINLIFHFNFLSYLRDFSPAGLHRERKCSCRLLEKVLLEYAFLILYHELIFLYYITIFFSKLTSFSSYTKFLNGGNVLLRGTVVASAEDLGTRDHGFDSLNAHIMYQ